MISPQVLIQLSLDWVTVLQEVMVVATGPDEVTGAGVISAELEDEGVAAAEELGEATGVLEDTRGELEDSTGVLEEATGVLEDTTGVLEGAEELGTTTGELEGAAVSEVVDWAAEVMTTELLRVEHTPGIV